MGSNPQNALKHPGLVFRPNTFTCVSSEVRLQMRALEVGLPAAREVADIIPATGEVHADDATLTRRHIERGGGQGQQLGVTQGHDCLWALLRHGGLGHHEHHRALGDRRRHQDGLRECSCLGQDGLHRVGGAPDRGLDDGRDHSGLSVHWQHLANDRGAGNGARRQESGSFASAAREARLCGRAGRTFAQV